MLRMWLRAVSRLASGKFDFEVYVRVLCDAPPRAPPREVQPLWDPPKPRSRVERDLDKTLDAIFDEPEADGAENKVAEAVAANLGAAATTGASAALAFAAADEPDAPTYQGHASHTLSDLLHFDATRLAKLGVCTGNRARQLAHELASLRRVVTSEE